MAGDASGPRWARGRPLPHHREHADELERLLDQYGPGKDLVRLGGSDDLYLRSITWARWRLGLPLPVPVER